MAPNIFLTGATGYIGGEILYTVSKAHPDWKFTCMVRDKAKGEKVSAAFPKAKLVYGDVDSLDLLFEEASKADIVFHTAASDDHIPSAEAIVQGLSQRQSSLPAYYIHTSGAFILAAETVNTGRYGDRFDKVHDDWDNVEELTRFPDYAPHRMVDKIVLAAKSDRIKTAIVAPSVVYGCGRGPVKTKMAALFQSLLQHRKMVVVGNGDNIWHNIHIQDLGRMYLLLGESAAAGGGAASWNTMGYYLAENGSYVTREMLQLAARIAHEKGYLPQPEVEFITVEESEKISPWLKVMVGGDSRGIALRAKKLLGWAPCMISFEEELGHTLDIAAQDIGLT